MTNHEDEAAIAGIVSIWDRHHAGIVYIAQEIADPIRGWEFVESYYGRLPAANPVGRTRAGTRYSWAAGRYNGGTTPDPSICVSEHCANRALRSHRNRRSAVPAKV